MDPRIPKSQWGSGPWQDEPDQLAWNDQRTGLACQIRRSCVTGSLCGYAGVPPTHPYFGWHYDDKVRLQPGDLDDATIDDVGVVHAFLYALQGEMERGTIPLGMTLKAHQGITWSGGFPIDDDADSLWWFGFDTGHAGDLMPGMRRTDVFLRGFLPPDLMRQYENMVANSKYRDLNYVRAEVTSLAFQLRQLETRVLIDDGVLKFIGKMT